MKYLRLNNLDIPIPDTVNCAVTLQINDIRDISKRSASASKTIAVKSTPVVDFFFGNIYDIQSTFSGQTFDVTRRTPCKLIDNDTVIIDGYLRMINISNNKGEIVYNVGVFGKVANLFADMREDYIDEQIDTLLASITQSRAVYEASWNTNLPYYFTPINRNSALTDGTVISYDTFVMTWNIKFLFVKILEHYGYTFTSDLFDEDFFKDLFIYCPPVAAPASVDVTDAREVTMELAANRIDTIIPLPESSNIDSRRMKGNYSYQGGYAAYYFCSDMGEIAVPAFNIDFPVTKDIYGRVTAGRWRPLQGALHKASFVIEIDNVEASAFGGATFTEVSYIEIQTWGAANGITLEQEQYRKTIEGPFIGGDTVIAELQFTPQVQIEYYFKIKYVTRGKGTTTVASQFATLLTDTILIPAHVEIGAGSSITINQIGATVVIGGLLPFFPNEKLPHIKCKDFVKSVFKMFNMMVDVDRENDHNLVMEPYPDFYNQGQIDWSDKLARDKEIVITPISELTSKTLKYRHRNVDDAYSNLYKSEQQFQYGEASLIIQNEFAEGETVTETGFGLVPPSDITADGVPFVNLFDKDGAVMTTDIGIIGSRFLIATPVRINYVTTFANYAYVPMFMDILGGATPFSIGFQAPKKVYYTGTLASNYPNNNLFTLFYSTQLSEFADPSSRMLAAYFSLNEMDIYNFDFRKEILVDNTLFRVNKIENYNGANGLTKVELLKVVNATVDLLPPSDLAQQTKVFSLVDGGIDNIFAAFREWNVDVIDGGEDITIGPVVIENVTSIDGGRS